MAGSNATKREKSAKATLQRRGRNIDDMVNEMTQGRPTRTQAKKKASKKKAKKK